MLDVNQQRMLATWVNKNSKRLNDRIAKSRSQADFRAVLVDATEYYNQLLSERDINARALDDTLQLLEEGPSSEQRDTWPATETELRREVEIRQQIISEFDRHIGACEALIAWVQGQLTPVEMDAAAVPLAPAVVPASAVTPAPAESSAPAVASAEAVASAPAVTRRSLQVPNLRRLLVMAAGVLGIVLAVWLLFSLVRGPQSASGKPPAATAIRPAGNQSGQALTPGASTPSSGQATPLGVGSSSPTPILVAAAAETTQATSLPARASETAASRSTSTKTPTPAPTATQTRAPTSTPTASPTPEPSSTPTPTATVTLAPTQEVTSPADAAVPVPPRPSPTSISVSAPVPLEPSAGESRRGNVNFAWRPGSPLPPGAAYEVVWWNLGEDPAAARGIAATTTETSLTANVDFLQSSAQLTSSDFYWTVIVVQTTPYVRLIQPAQSAPQRLSYSSPSQPPPPKP